MAKPSRRFTANVGDPSTGNAGPDAIEEDLDKAFAMFDPLATLPVTGEAGGIGTDNIRDGAVTDAKLNTANTRTLKAVLETEATLPGTATVGDLYLVKSISGGGPGLYVYSTTGWKLLSQAVQPAIPAGSIMPFAGSTPPSGWLECNGAAISRTQYSALFAAIGTTYGTGDGLTTFNLPDLRGEFLRGWDHGRGVDPGRALGSWQADELRSHTHSYAQNVYNPTYGPVNGSGYVNQTTGETGATGGTETRPRNVAVMYIIKY